MDTPIEEDKEVFQLGLPKNILNVPFPGCTYCLRKSFVEECLPYWNDVCPHDALFYRSALLKGSGYILNKPLIIWRRYNQSSWNKETQTINADTEKEWRKKELAEVILLLVYAEDLNLSTTTKETLNRNKNWISTRIDLYEKHYSKIFELLEYKNLYNMKGIIKDFLLTLGIYKK